MSDEIISRKTRTEFREFLGSWTLQQIRDEFEAAGVARDESFDPKLSGARKSLVEQYYHSLDLTNVADARRLLAAYESILNSAMQWAQDDGTGDQTRRAVGALIEWLRRDGFDYRDGSVVPVTPEARQALAVSRDSHRISEVTRRDIFDFIRIDNIAWAGRLSEIEFLDRLYDLDSLPSTDPRPWSQSARQDIATHRIAFPEDWSDDWVLTDARFGLETGADEVFLAFLTEMLHPVVRSYEQARSVVDTLNVYLAPDGWEIAEHGDISGRPVFAARRLSPSEERAFEEKSERQFLEEDLRSVSLSSAPIEAALLPVLESRLSEAVRCLDSDAPLAVIFLCGSVLEGILLSMAQASPKQFNEAARSPRVDGKVKPFGEWRLSEFIDVACEVGCLTLDVKKFSHALRDFRNYIHPYQQMKSGFAPDEHTARICLQVLRAAIACVSGQRGRT